MPNARLREVKLPEFGEAPELPELSPKIHSTRLERLRARMLAVGLDGVVIYADREHSANMAWLTGFDPRFEEALFILADQARPVLLTGPENQGLAKILPLEPEVVLYPPMGLMGQDRAKTPQLAELLARASIAKGMHIGVCGWKYFGTDESSAPQTWLEIPSYIADCLRGLVGDAGSVTNAGAILMDPQDGLRASLELEELARFEYFACHTSEAVKRVVLGTRPGMSEFEAAQLLRPVGLPLSCHTMFSSGGRAWNGLNSPSTKIVEKGDAVTTAYGVQGALNCRAGWLAAGPEDLPGNVHDYVEKLVVPYFEAVAEWLAMVRIGIGGGALYDAVMKRLGDPFFGVFLNPGHLIHIDEWMHSPISSGSNARLASGMALQVDVIPATGGPYFTSNMEDGIALLDERGRAEFAERWPQAWGRIEARRNFMAESLGIVCHADVLPFSNLASWLPPFWLNPDRAMSLK